MSSLAFRDSSILILETTTDFIRAGLGLNDLLRAPTVEIPARVGVRTSLLGADSQATNGNATPASARPSFRLGEGLDVQPSASTSRAASAMPQAHSASAPRLTDYLVGRQLDEALEAGQDITVFWPFAHGEVRDWIQVEALWKYVLFTALQLRRVQFENPVLLCIYSGLSRDAHERICQIFFERFNVAAFSVLDRTVAQLYAANALSGVVVDIHESHTDITPVYDGVPLNLARTTILVGTADCERYLAQLLRSNTSVMSTLSPSDAPLDAPALDDALRALARQAWRDGLVKVPSSGEAAPPPEDEGVTDIAAVLVAGKEKAVIENGMKKRATAKASAAEQARAREIEALDLVTLQFHGKEVTLGKERHRFCEPLFDPSLMGAEEFERRSKDGLVMPLHDAAGHAVGQTEVDQRQYIWMGLLVTGDITGSVKGIGPALQSRLSPYILSNPDQQTDVQPRQIRIIKVPEYFAEFREKGDGLAAFLGSCIVAKITFHDPNAKNFASKADYTEHGPKTVLEMSPCLL